MTLARYRAICVTCLCKGVCFRLTHLNPKSVTNMQHVAPHPSNAISLRQGLAGFVSVDCAFSLSGAPAARG